MIENVLHAKVTDQLPKLMSQTIPQFTNYLHRSSWPPRSWPWLSRSTSRSNDRKRPTHQSCRPITRVKVLNDSSTHGLSSPSFVTSKVMTFQVKSRSNDRKRPTRQSYWSITKVKVSNDSSDHGLSSPRFVTSKVMTSQVNFKIKW